MSKTIVNIKNMFVGGVPPSLRPSIADLRVGIIPDGRNCDCADAEAEEEDEDEDIVAGIIEEIGVGGADYAFADAGGTVVPFPVVARAVKSFYEWWEDGAPLHGSHGVCPIRPFPADPVPDSTVPPTQDPPVAV